MQIGAQFYTLREQCKTLDGLEMSLKRVAEIGYRTVQISGVCEYDPVWLAEQLRANGLRCVLTHTPPERIETETEAVLLDHAAFDCPYIGIGYNDLSDGAAAFAARFLPAARRLAQAGCLLMYHNHDHEFQRQGKELLLEELARLFPPELLGFTLDTYWVQAGGGDPIWWLRHLRGRTPCVHLKDMAYGRKMAPVGEGNMNFEGILAACEETGVSYALVEQDDCNGEDPFDCLRRSYQYLRSCGLS